MHRFENIHLYKVPWPWNPGQESFKVIGNDAIQ